MNWLNLTPPQWVSGLLIATSVVLILAAWYVWSKLMISWVKERAPRIQLRWPITMRHPISAPTIPLLYVGEMTVSDKHLQDALFLEIAARGFNATPAPVIVKQSRGYLTCGNTQLPPPNLLFERGPRDGIIPERAEFIVVLEQRVPRTIAAQLASLSERVPLDLGNLNIMMALQEDHSKEVRLPLYDGMMLYKDRAIAGQ